MVVGCPGAGKSWLAARVAEATGLPLVRLDKEFWHPGWLPTPHDVWLVHVAKLAASETWVMDGNYAGTLEIRLPRADLIIYLDLPRWQCMLSLFRRTFAYLGQTRPSMADGCPERFDLGFIKHAWQCRKAIRRPTIAGIRALRPDQRGIVLHSRADVNRFAAALPDSLTERAA